MQTTKGKRGLNRGVLGGVGVGAGLPLGLAAALTCGSAGAFQIPAGQDFEIHFDNSVKYNLGFRAQGMDDKIGNNPLLDSADYKFAKVGDIVTDRISDLAEFDLVYKGNYGMRVSGSGWKDFAYDDKVEHNPGYLLPPGFLRPGTPGLPYSGFTSYTGDVYSKHTKRFYETGGELLDAFVFADFDIFGHDSSVRLGRLTQFWGNALIFGAEGINYGQNASDSIKALNAPGTQAKELAIPRTQVLFQTAVTPTMTFAAQYFAEFYPNLNPEGGTYLGTFDVAFDGPNQIQIGQGTKLTIPHGTDIEPNGLHANYGFKYTWSPNWLRGTVGAYYRHLDEPSPWLLPGFKLDGFATPQRSLIDYRLKYNPNVQLFGLSLDKQIGIYSTGFEVSYRENTAMNTLGIPSLPSIAASTGAGNRLVNDQGPTGDTVNVIANVLSSMPSSRLYSAGTFLVETAYTHKVKVSNDASMYSGVENQNPLSGCIFKTKWGGCATNNAVAVAALVDPQWLQVFPGIDLDMPLFGDYGIYGNTPSLGGSSQGAWIYTGGVHALIQQRYNVTVAYNGYYAHTNGTSRLGGNLPNAGPTYDTTSTEAFFFNDKGWVSLTFSTVF